MKDNGSWDKIPQDPSSEEQLPETSESTWQEHSENFSASDVQDGEQYTTEESEPTSDGWRQLDQQTDFERFRTKKKKKSGKSGKKSKKNSKSSPNTEKSAKKKKKQSMLTNILLVAVLVVGLSVMLYPTISDYINSLHASQAIADYSQKVEEMSEEEIQAYFDAADAYNAKVRELSFPFQDYKQIEDEYNSTLDVTGTGIMGVVTIGKINVELPIYHGTSEGVLQVAAGHLEGSTLPVGGESTHAVLSAHRGLPTAKLFTHLDKLTEGDVFSITVLNRDFYYQVDQILIVKPTEMDAMLIEDGKDYVTLQTCTPYGINTHRMLVRAHRVESPEGSAVVQANAVRVPVIMVIGAITVPTMFIILVILLIVYRIRPSRMATPEDIARLSELKARTEQKKRNSSDKK